MTDNLQPARLDPLRLAQVTKALADPSRIELLRLLSRDGGCCDAPAGSRPDAVCVCDLVDRTGLLQSLVSYHMRVLREAGLVREERHGRWKHYRIDEQAARTFLDSWSELLLTP